MSKRSVILIEVNGGVAEHTRTYGRKQRVIIVERQLTDDLLSMAGDKPDKVWLLGIVSGMTLALYASNEKFSVNFIPQLHKKLLDTIK